MIFTITTLAAIYGITAFVFTLLFLYVWRRRDAPGGYYFCMIIIAAIVWSFCAMMEMALVDIQLKIIFSKLAYIGIVAIAPLWVLFNVSYAQRSRIVSRKLGLLVWFVPTIVLALVMTNEWHHIVWTSITPTSAEPGAILIYEHGPGFYLAIVYSYLLTLIGVFLLIKTSFQVYRQFFMQTITLALGALIPIAGSVIYVLWMSGTDGIDPTPFALLTTGLIYGWSMFRYQLFDIVPVAREMLIGSMIEGVIVIDIKDRVIDMNPAARQMIGNNGSLGQPIARLLARCPELQACCMELNDEPREVMLDCPCGIRWLNVTVSPLLDNSGQVTGRLVVMRDITKRMIVEKALDESRVNFRMLFDTVDDLLVVLDPSGVILEVNSAVARRLGYARDELIGTHGSMFLQKGETAVLKQAQVDMSPGTVTTGISALLAKNGEIIRVETHMVSGRWGGKPAIFGISRDITELMRQQEVLKRSNESLSAEIEERKRMERQMESSLREKEVLLKEVHHRVKNNMQIINSMLNLQMSGETRKEVIMAFRESQNRIISMALVHEKLYQSADLAHIDFAEYVGSIVAYLRRSYTQDRGVAVEIDFPSIFASIDGAIPCGLIINELVSNSLKYAFREKADGGIRLSFTCSGDVCVLSVGDDGIGLPPGLDFRNTGSLGLQLVNTLVDQIEGTIDLADGPGTTFVIRFRTRMLVGHVAGESILGGNKSPMSG